MRKYLSLLFILGATSFMGFGQSNRALKCGTEFTPAMRMRLQRNIAASKQADFHKSNVTTYVPIKIIRVADNSGNNRVLASRIFDALCVLNNNYADQDIQFYISGGFKNVDNTVLANHTTSTGPRTQMNLHKVDDALNVFVCNIVNSTNTTGITLGYYNSNVDGIAIRNNQMNTNSATLTHEIGHFFSLPHPFLGWESINYHATYSASNPPPASLVTAQGTFEVELADGSNSATAGDMFSDTPADYNLGNVENDCNYSSGAVDPTGAAIDPDESLFMSYFSDNCVSKFTTQQKAAIMADLNSNGRSHLINNPPSTTIKVNDEAVLLSPQDNGFATNGYDDVLLDWDDVPNATGYLVQVSRFSSFTVLQEEVIVSQSSHNVLTLEPNRNYYWRVMPFNEVTTCHSFGDHRVFTTPAHTVSTFVIEGVNDFSLQPNLANSGQPVWVSITTEKSFEAALKVYNLAGQLVQGGETTTFNVGRTTHTIPTHQLSAGMYIISLDTGKGHLNKKLVVMD